LRELVGLHSAWGSKVLLEKSLVRLVRDEGCAVGDEGVQAAGVVKVVMRVDHEFDRLVGHRLLHFGNQRGGVGVVLRSVDHYQMVPHLDQYAVKRRCA
jgi:hypothetical protein